VIVPKMRLDVACGPRIPCREFWREWPPSFLPSFFPYGRVRPWGTTYNNGQLLNYLNRHPSKPSGPLTPLLGLLDSWTLELWNVPPTYPRIVPLGPPN
jgi:hypothetical protein